MNAHRVTVDKYSSHNPILNKEIIIMNVWMSLQTDICTDEVLFDPLKRINFRRLENEKLLI